MASMSKAQLEEYLGEPRHAIVATNGGDGPPQLSPVWYIYREGTMYISTSDTTAKINNLRADPSISVCVDGGRGDSRYVVLLGKVTIIPNKSQEQQDLRWDIIRHYHEDERAAREYYESAEDDSQVVIVLTPDKIISQDFN